MLTFLPFATTMRPYGCFSLGHILTCFPAFDRTALTRWAARGLIVRLRNGWYALAESLNTTDFRWLVANQIYSPSYISLHYALAFYGMIPETVVQLTSVTTLKTATFDNAAGRFAYQSVAPRLFFGYTLKRIDERHAVRFATPEKALLDLLHLNPYYSSASDYLDLRLDDSYMQDDFDRQLFLDYAARAGGKTLAARARTLLKTYDL